MNEFLTLTGFDVTQADSARACFQCIDSEEFDLILLDLTLPDEDGLVILRKLTQRLKIPIIVASGRKSDDDKIAGLEMGARDYIGKPFSLNELKLRIFNLIGEPSEAEEQGHTLQFHGFSLSERANVLTAPSGHKVQLTPHEYKVLLTLAHHIDKPVSRDHIIDASTELDMPETNRAVDISISRLRKKLNDTNKPPSKLMTIRGEGYMLTSA